MVVVSFLTSRFARRSHACRPPILPRGNFYDYALLPFCHLHQCNYVAIGSLEERWLIWSKKSACRRQAAVWYLIKRNAASRTKWNRSKWSPSIFVLWCSSEWQTMGKWLLLLQKIFGIQGSYGQLSLNSFKDTISISWLILERDCRSCLHFLCRALKTHVLK